ncbi:synaptotagmin-like protein 2 isoform X1 [Micropterus salmoides]|uniref:synaptotagmin-like protein 2 isoform X1 n=1 Tax=Micropterus salmoides TaxID=27706 RepID=UPI0018EE353C|nr:synaptotagmin-like protein 2 isoform X1 [Micropterus salmoides]XP_038550042.1 synaptotagmin-like protein 2 isoform X1 [Micropterus salmoides]
MIDLSHLTEEEQGVIMTVLRRDAELKKAEEERISKLEKILNSDSQSDTKRKYLTGEWFYEAKSRRHMDRIHGSEIILASMKPRKAGLDGSLRIERSKAPSSRGSDIVAPPKPARCLESLQPQEINDAEKENLNSFTRSPRMPRHNPFNRASLIVVEPPENNNDMSTGRDQESSEIDPISPLKSHPAGEASRTSGGSVTSEGSSVGFRPVPKKRTFLSRRTSSQSESNSLGSDTQVGSAGVFPAPRRSLQQGSSGSSNQSSLKGQDEKPQKCLVSKQVAVSAPPSTSLDENSQQPLGGIFQVLSNFSVEREKTPPSITKDRSVDSSSNGSHKNIVTKLSNPSAATHNRYNYRPAMYTRSDASTEREIPQRSDERDDQTQRQHAALNSVILHTSSIQDSDSGGNAMKQEELSLTQSTVDPDPDPPVSYDLNFIDKSDQKTQKKSNQKDVFKLSTQTTSPTGDEDSIAKVLDWFSRSTDSSDWLNTEDSPEAAKSSDKHVEISKLRDEDSSRKDSRDSVSDGKKESLEMKRNHVQRQTNVAKELRATDSISNKELPKTQEEVNRDARERMRPQEVKDNNDESQPPQISHLKSFWEKSNTGPKILISKSITPSDKGQKPHLSADKDEEKVIKPHRVSDMPSVAGIHNGKGIYDEYASNHGDERKQQLEISPQKDTGDNVCLNNYQKVDRLVMNSSTQRNNTDPTYNSGILKLAASPQDKGGSDTEILCPQSRTPNQRPESESAYLVKPNPQPDSISPSKETQLQDELSKLLDTDLQAMDSSDSEKLYLSRNSPYMNYKQGGNDMQITPKAQLRRGSSEDIKRRDNEDKIVQSSMSPKRKEDTSNKDRSNSPHSNRHQESTAERIKQLRSFWEQEKNKPMFYTGKPKASGDGKVARGANQGKLNKRFTKSEYDLTSIGNNSGSEEEESERNHQHFTVLPLNQRIEKLSPSLGTSRTQFNTLREFWDEATSDTKGLFSFDKPKSPKRKEPLSSQLPSHELKCSDPEIHRVNIAFEKTRPAVMKSSPPPQKQSKSPHDRQMGSRAAYDSKNNLCNYMTAETGQQREPRRNSKDSNREGISTKPQNSSVTRSPKNRKDSFSNSSSRGNSMRRATSMFALSVPDEKDQSQLKIDVSPVHSQSRKQRQSPEKGALPRRSSEESETLTPRARAYVPRDYRHYLGMTDKTNVHTSLTPALKNERSEDKSRYGFDLAAPVRSSTPVSSEERHSRKGSKTSQRPPWANHSGSDTGPESSVSSTSETWSSLRNGSNCENDDEGHNPVRKALRRAEARPKNLAKSMEDITVSLSPRQERRQDATADMRRVSDVSSIPSPSSSLFSDPEHLKKMSKSVPSFLQKEDVDRDSDSNCEDSYHRGRLMANSLTNLTSSSGMASVSSLSGSVMTMYSGEFGNVEVQGNIHFSINYIQRLKEFHIFVAECQDLAAVDPKRGRSDPYVKSYLVPDKAHLGKRKTSVKKKTLNPTFKEILRYRVRMDYLRTQTLILSVWHNDTFGRNSFLGEVDMDLSKWDFDHTQMNYLPLKARTMPTLAPSNGRGEMRLAIRFLPQIIHSEGLAKESPNTGEVHIWVKECKNLPLIRATIDPYVKCFVLPDTSRKSRQKTRVLRRTVDPVFNHTMVYDGIQEADLAEACVELTVWDRDRLASNLLGGLRLGAGTGRSYGAAVDWMDSTPYEVALWERMKATPNEWVEDVLPIRMLSSAKTAFK